MCDDANKGTCQCASTAEATTDKKECCEGGTCTCEVTPTTEPTTAPADTTPSV